MKISGKLLTGFIIVALIAGLIGGYSSINMRTIADKGELVYEKMTIPISQLLKIAETFQRIRINVLLIANSTDTNDLDKYVSRIEEYKKIIKEYADKFEKNILGSKLRAAYKAWLKTRTGYGKAEKIIVNLIRNKKFTEATKYANSGGAAAAQAEMKAIQTLTNIKLKDAETISDESVQSAKTAIGIMIGVSIVGFIIAIVMGIFISRSITNPLKQGVTFSETISKKDLTVELDKKLVDRYDEIGSLSKAITAMKNNLVTIMHELGDVSGNLASSSEEIAASAQSLADGAQSQSASVEETSASIEELGASITQVAQNAEDINMKSEELMNTAQESSVLVNNAITSMDKINESSLLISEILTVINDIADQTNLLALNAAIEAARAGEHGRGFAVVADEISKLADKSTENSKEIEKLIKQSIRDIESGTQAVKKSGEAFNTIISGVDANNMLIDQISKAIEQQKVGSDQVQKAVEEINDVTQTTSASAEEMAASTEELQAQAENIKNLIEEFKLTKEKKSIKAVE
jgi:methyl-accepting chemotaxis protein